MGLLHFKYYQASGGGPNLWKAVGLAKDLNHLNTLNLGFVHYKKLMKIQFLKYGKT